MSLPLWGIIAALLSVLTGLLLPGGAGVALLVPLIALVACPLGALLGWGIARACRRSSQAR